MGKKIARHADHDAFGTSFHNVTINATLRELMTLFPESYISTGNFGDDKVNFSFTLANSDGDIFTIYDWKEYRPLTLDETVEWHIGGYGVLSELQAKDDVTLMLEELRYKESLIGTL